MAGWQRAVEENLSVYFTSGRVAIDLMKQRGEGLFIAVVNNDTAQNDTPDDIGRMLLDGQNNLAYGFFKEVEDTGVNFYHLYVNPEPGENIPNPTTERHNSESLGDYIISLYNGNEQPILGPFLYLNKNISSGRNRYMSDN